MKNYKCFIAILSLALLAGCATTKIQSGNYKFNFNYDGRKYNIKSYNPENQIGYNILNYNNGKSVTFSAVDLEQDGYIDKIINGTVSVNFAQSVYKAGLARGRMAGAVRKRYNDRIYNYSDGNNFYSLHTYELAIGKVYNKMIISERDSPFFKKIITDSNADGVLNVIEKDGGNDLKFYQRYYSDLIAMGMEAGKVIKTGNKYVVAIK